MYGLHNKCVFFLPCVRFPLPIFHSQLFLFFFLTHTRAPPHILRTIRGHIHRTGGFLHIGYRRCTCQVSAGHVRGRSTSGTGTRLMERRRPQQFAVIRTFVRYMVMYMWLVRVNQFLDDRLTKNIATVIVSRTLPTHVLPRTFSAQFTGTFVALGGSATCRTHVFITSIACNDTIACGTNFHLARSAETDSLVVNHARVANGNVASAANVLCHFRYVIFNRT